MMHGPINIRLGRPVSFFSDIVDISYGKEFAKLFHVFFMHTQMQKT